MTIAKDFATKASVAFVAAAMIFTMFAPSAKAQSSEDLQKMINDLLAQIATLQSQVGQGSSSSASGVCPYTWTRDLKTGATGADVMKLQQFLNANADTRVAATGAGSVGMETEYYGPATAAAVSKFQVMYRAEVLAGLVNPTGYFGPASRAKANALCVAAPVVTPGTGTDTGTGTSTDDGDDNSSVTLSGEAGLGTFDMFDADDSSIEEGDEEVAIGSVEVTFKDGDAEISRLDVALTGGTPWQTFDSVALMVDGEVVAEANAGSKSDYLSSTNKTLRFSGLSLVAEEDETLVITVIATVKDTVRSLSSNDNWTLKVDSMRWSDADGVTTTEPNTVLIGSADFTIESEGTNDKASIKKNNDNPDAYTIVVDDGSNASDAETVLVFNIDVDEDSADTSLGMAYATVTVSTGTLTKIVDKVEMTIDGKKITGKVSTSATTTAVYKFDYKDMVLAADGVYKGSVDITFKGQNSGTNYGEGVTVTASVTGEDWELESDKTGDYILKGTQPGKAHTLSSIDVTIGSYKWEVSSAGTFADLLFEVTANENDFTVDAATIASSTVTGSTATTSAGVLSVVTGDATEVTAGSKYKVEEGDTATIRLRYSINGTNGQYANVKVTEISGQPVPTATQTSPTVTRNVN